MYSILKIDYATTVLVDFRQFCIKAADNFSFIEQKNYNVYEVVDK